jgi:hypothetical protein
VTELMVWALQHCFIARWSIDGGKPIDTVLKQVGLHPWTYEEACIGICVGRRIMAT